jgi:hypothetical protein
VARMNRPGTAGAHNWGWQMRPGSLTEAHAARLRELTLLYGRTSPPGSLSYAERGPGGEVRVLHSSSVRPLAGRLPFYRPTCHARAHPAPAIDPARRYR